MGPGPQIVSAASRLSPDWMWLSIGLGLGLGVLLVVGYVTASRSRIARLAREHPQSLRLAVSGAGALHRAGRSVSTGLQDPGIHFPTFGIAGIAVDQEGIRIAGSRRGRIGLIPAARIERVAAGEVSVWGSALEVIIVTVDMGERRVDLAMTPSRSKRLGPFGHEDVAGLVELIRGRLDPVNGMTGTRGTVF